MGQQDKKNRTGTRLATPAVADPIARKMESLRRKLDPRRFPDISPFMGAVVGFVLGVSFTNPDIAEIKVSERENLVYIRQAGDVGFNELQSLEDLRNNWNGFMDAADLTGEERKEATWMFWARIRLEVETEL